MLAEDSSPGEVSSIPHNSTVMDLERSLAGIKIDENPWRSQHGETPQVRSFHPISHKKIILAVGTNAWRS